MSEHVLQALHAKDLDARVVAIDAAASALQKRQLRGAALDAVAERLVACAGAREWEVRRAVARAALHLDHELYDPIVAKLERDSHRYVKRAAAETVSRRHNKERGSLLKKQHAELLEQWLEKFVRDHGPDAGADAMKLCRRFAHVYLQEIEHEARNVLGTLDTTLGNLARGLDEDVVDIPAAKKRVERSRRQPKLLAEMIHALCDITYETDAKFHRERLADIIELAKESALRGDADGARARAISIDVDPSIHIEAHRARLVQACTNLIKNAFEAYDGEPGGVRVVAHEADGSVTLKVIDEGCGMTAEQQAETFRLFSSTKGRGRGFGLTLAKEIVTVEHRGTLRIDSEEGRGTTVAMELSVRQMTKRELAE